MISTTITEREVTRAVDMRPVIFRMPHDLHEELAIHLFQNGRRKFQGFALDAVREKLAAEKRKKRTSK